MLITHFGDIEGMLEKIAYKGHRETRIEYAPKHITNSPALYYWGAVYDESSLSSAITIALILDGLKLNDPLVDGFCHCFCEGCYM
jgi:hypothetical protein